jgi:hypothetical protein
MRLARHNILDIVVAVLAAAAATLLVVRLVTGSARDGMSGPYDPRSAELELIGTLAPPLRVLSAVSGDATVLSLASGHVTVVLLFDPRCASGMDAARDWGRLARQAPDSVRLVALALDSSESRDRFPDARVVELRAVRPGDLRRSLRIRYVPTAFVTDRSGRIGWVRVGYLTPTAIDSLVRFLRPS